MKNLRCKIISFVTVFSMIMSFFTGILSAYADSNAAKWYLSEDFSAYITNAAADSVNITYGTGMVLENEDKDNKYIEVSQSKGTIGFSQEFNSTASVNDFIFTIDVGFEGGLDNADINLTTSSGNFTVAKIGGDKALMTYDGKKVGTLSSQKLTTLTFTFNKLHSRYNIYVNGQKIANDYYIDVAYPDSFTGYSISGVLNGELKFFADNAYAYTSDKILAKNVLPRKSYNEDSVEIVTYEDVYIEDTRISSYFNFEDDPRKYHEMVKNFSMEYVPNGNSIEVKQEENGNKYLSMDSLPDGKNFFSVIPCANLQQLVVEFDVCTPTLSTINLLAFDALNNNTSILSSDTNLKLSSNGKSVGYLDNKSWVNIKLVIDNYTKLINIYVYGEHTGVDVPMQSDILTDIGRIRFLAGRNHDSNTVMVDNIVVYAGTELYDYSKTLSGEVDENSNVYSHNVKGIEKFLESYNAIHTSTGKFYIDSMTTVTKMPYYENDVLYVSLADAERLVFGASATVSDEFVSLDKFAGDNGKVVTYTRTGTVLVGDKQAVISEKMIKLLNAHMTYDRPNAAVLESAFASSHPRITINAERLEKIKSEYGKNKYITQWGNSYIRDAETYLNVDPQVYIAPTLDNVGRMLAPGRTIRERVQKLALAYHLTGEQKYVDRAWVELENACNFPDWHQQIHELDSAMVSSALAYGYDWLYHQWTPQQRKIMEDALYRNQLDQAQEVYHGSRTYGWASQTNNWNPHCNGYTALAAIAIYESNPHKCADIISSAMKNMEYALIEFYPNGAWKEGPSYWNGTVEPIGELCSSLVNAFGSSYCIEKTACLDVTADYVLGTSGPVGVNNYNDCATLLESTRATFLWFSNTFNKPELTSVRMKEIDKGISDSGILDMCYLNTDLELGNVEIPLDTYFEGLEMVTFKSAQGDQNAAYVSFHSGENMEGGDHSHIDSGTFVLDMLGERFAKDPGAHYYYSTGWGKVIYTQPTEDALTRWRYYQNVPDGHNTLLINPDKTIGQNIISDDKIESFVSKERGAYAITSLSSAYKGYAKNVKRGIMLSDERRSVTVRDEIELNEGNNEVYWFMHTDITNNITYVDDNTFIMNQKGKKVKVMLLTNADSHEVYEGECVQMGLEPSPEQVPIKNLKRLTIKMNAKGSLYLQVKFIPLDDPIADVAPENMPLDTWSIPDGEIQELPSINALYLDGVKNDSFDPDAAVNDIPVDITLTKVPAITWDIDDEFDVETTKHPSSIDDSYIIRVWRKDSPEIYRTYTITFNPYSLEALEPYKIIPITAEASHVPQQENGPDKTYDNDINTRWAADGEGVWLISDLGEVKDVDFIGVSFMNGDQRMATYQLFLSEDKENWEMVFDGVSSGTTTNIEIGERIGKKARYIKLVGFGNSSNEWNSINELCAYSLGF